MKKLHVYGTCLIRIDDQLIQIHGKQEFDPQEIAAVFQVNPAELNVVEDNKLE